MQIDVSNSLNDSEIIWRYMTIEKLIDLLESKTLFFTPLSYYFHDDPFEGCIPANAFYAFSSSTRALSRGLPEEQRRRAYEKSIKEYKSFTSCISINCWHLNEQESDAMWKMYSANGNGVAIKTKVKKLQTSLIDDRDINIKIGRVKYLDFFDKNLDPNECVTDGVLFPLLKRKSYSHESEMRAYILPQLDVNVLDLTPKPQIIKIDTDTLIENIFISPFASSLYSKSVAAICKKFGIDESKLDFSKLLLGKDYLFNIDRFFSIEDDRQKRIFDS